MIHNTRSFQDDFLSLPLILSPAPPAVFHLLPTALGKLPEFSSVSAPPLCRPAAAVSVCLTTRPLSRLVSPKLFKLISLNVFSKKKR